MQMLFLDPFYQSLEEYYHVNKNVDSASRGNIKNT